MTAWISVVLALALDGLAGLSGGLLSERWLARHLVALVSFAAGTLLAAVFLEILPEAVAHLGPRALPWAFGGFVLAGIILAIAGGSFLYVGTIDLAPELRSIVRSGARDRRAIAFVVGVTLVAALVLLW